ncbi:hypothetical protein B0H19DRAFT_1310067 [Mycena capillaripes]|nr:hypothetical protein B0H19DRAFT_1310067 [Mycena capillaripes]
MKEWLSTTDAELTYSGLPIENLGANPLVTTVTFCSKRTANLCSGPAMSSLARAFATLRRVRTASRRRLTWRSAITQAAGQLPHTERVWYAPGWWVLLHPGHQLHFAPKLAPSWDTKADSRQTNWHRRTSYCVKRDGHL